MTSLPAPAEPALRPATGDRPALKPRGTARQGFGATSRLDSWWMAPAVQGTVFTICATYLFISGILLTPLFGTPYEADGYLSPLFSPLIAPSWLPSWISPGLLILWIPLGFRATCYYYRKAYYRFYFADPPACAVGEPTVHRRFRMETALPFILQNVHRYFLYLAFFPLFFLWVDAAASLRFEGQWRIGLGVIVLFANALFLTGYSLSCHSIRHIVGGKVDCFSCSRRTQVRYTLWQRLTSLNRCHMAWAWISLHDRDVRRHLRPPACRRGHHRSRDPLLGGSMAGVTDLERHPHDVLVIGAGGAGLRAAIEARAAGADVGLVCKSLLGKAHTVMAEGGVAAALAHVAENDSWQIHFRDTMVGGKYLNNPRMVQLHAQEAPDRVRELELWGAVFDRTRDGRILQRPFGGHTNPRLAHVGDRTGLEMIRTLQDRAVGLGIRVYMETTITRLTTGGSRVTGAVGYSRIDRSAGRLPGPGGRPRDRRHRQGLRGHLELVGVQRRRSGARLRGRRRADRHGVRPVPPDRDGLAAGCPWPARDRGGPGRGRHPPEQGRRAVHVEIPSRGASRGVRGDRRRGGQMGQRPVGEPDDGRAAAARAVDPGQRRAGDLHGSERGPRLAPRRCPARHQLSAGRPRPPQAALDV